MTFQEKLVVLRKIKSLTQDEFASAVGVSRQAVYKWESGQSYPEVSKLIEIKMLFGISIDDLLDDTYEIALPEKKKRKRISREEKERIEREILIEEGLLSVEEEKKEEPVCVAAPAAAEAPMAVDNEVRVEEKKEEPEVKEPKKVGFFGKLFGKK